MKPNSPRSPALERPGTRFEGYFGAKHIYHGHWGSDSVRWRVAVSWYPKQLWLFCATCSGATSEDLEGLSREPCVHVAGGGGVLSEQRTSRGHGPGVQRKLLEDS